MLYIIVVVLEHTPFLPCPHTFFHQFIPTFSFFFKKFLCACLFTFLMAFGHFKLLQFATSGTPPRTREESYQPKLWLSYMYSTTVAPVVIPTSRVNSQCSGPLKYSTRNRAKGCLHQPGAKWWVPSPWQRQCGRAQCTGARYSGPLSLSIYYRLSLKIIKTKCILYLVKELHAAYTQQWEEEVTNARQQESLHRRPWLCSHHVTA